MLKLFFVADVSDDGENQDQFVVAGDQSEAVVLWRGCYDVAPDAQPDRVFRVPVMLAGKYPVARALGWHADVRQVGGAKELLPPG